MRTTNNIKNGPPNNSKLTALHNAAAFGPVGSVRELLTAGANLNAQDSRKLAPLSFALATDYPSIEIVRTLLRAGADVNLADSNGDTPIDWAEKFGYPEIIAELRKAGGRTHQAPRAPVQQRPAQPAVALQRTLSLLEATTATFFNGSGCVSCHHQNLIVRAQAAAKAAGLSTNEAVEREQTLQMKSEWVSLREGFLQGLLPGGGAPRLAENLLGRHMADEGKPVTTEDYTMRLYGLHHAAAPQKDVKQAADALLALQRPDGGWAANPYLKSDAYATGVALTSLSESKALTAHDGAFRRGIDYLLSTQFSDGSWYVRSRSNKFQPYFESGFPFGHDQWISAAATAWAAQAIALGLEPGGETPSGTGNRQ